jgi:hypothetical protein
MTSIAPTSTAVTADELSSATNDGSSGLLKISPELRNRIYGYAFETVSSSGPIPHALTQVNQQIRGESRKMYYASVDCLVLPVRTLEQIRRTQKFLDEVGLSLYHMLPDIEFLSTTGNPYLEKIPISCRREEVLPAEELAFQLSLFSGDTTGMSDEGMFDAALESAYIHCLGFEANSLCLGSELPEDFERAIEEGDTWIMRVFDFGGAGTEAYEEADNKLFDMVFDLAASTNDEDWNWVDLELFVSSLESEHRYL